MADPVTIGAAVGWGVSAAGWLISPIISRLLNKGFAHLDYNASDKLKMLDIQVLKLQRAMEVVDESTYRVHLEPLLNKLKAALYEVEDILDSVEYQSLKKQIQDAKTQREEVRKAQHRHRLSGRLSLTRPLYATPYHPYAHAQGRGDRSGVCQRTYSSMTEYQESGMSKQELKKSLENIESAISDACKVLGQLNLPSVSSDSGRRRVATNSPSAVTTAGPPLRVIGREQDRDKIIAMLHEKEDQCQEYTIKGTGYSVIGIHGIAGSGKSTLAQCVYDHEKRHKEEKMEGHFDVVMWIHVSQIFDLDSIFHQMLEGATGKACHKYNSRNVLKEDLEDNLRGKKILLVLDDVWYCIRNSGYYELQKLISPVNVGKTGSRILVTSRTEDALVALGAVEERYIPISDLDDKVFLELFMYYALPGARVGGHDRIKLEMIGEDIAKKLKRSPLAARTVGSRLGLKQNVGFWMREKNRDLMSETMGALWWSYQYLDEHVRRCFAYCSIFPRGHHLKRDELVKLWVAEGFIKTSEPEEEMEDVAQYYFDELLSASFMQFGGKERSFESYSYGLDVDYFTIHDLLCDLAEEAAGRDCFRIEKGCTGVPQDVRYLYARTYNREIFSKKMRELQNLRTLILADSIHVKCEDLVSMFTMLTGLRKLRVLKLGLIGTGLNTFSFPDSIGQWKHLRYFAFQVATTKLTLPSAFTKLYHMQVVDFGACLSLAFSSGEDMMNLVNLRCVISWADLDFPSVGRLTWLQMLPSFKIRKKQGYEPHQLKDLNKLQNKLHIRGLENVQSKEEALEANLAGKEKLKGLMLQWDDETCAPEVQADVLEGLRPSKYLEILSIVNYKGMTLPNWMMGEHNGGPKNLQALRFHGWSQEGTAPDNGAFIHLHSLEIFRCSWNALAGLGHLTLLRKLEIRSCMNMRSLGMLPKSLEEFTVTGCTPEFKKLCHDAGPNRGKVEHIPYYISR